MSEIDRLHHAIEAHFEIMGVKPGIKRSAAMRKLIGEQIVKLVEPLDRCIMMANMRVGSLIQEHQMKRRFEEVPEKLTAMREFVAESERRVEAAKEKCSEGTITIDEFKEVVFDAMTARRATYPLDGEQPWDPERDPREALLDDDDIHSFAIWDTVVEPLQEALPALHQLACEDWKDENADDD